MKIVDLSYPITNKMLTYPGDPDVTIIQEKEIHTDRSLLHSFTLGTHTGTHLDVPAHIIPDGKKLGEFPLNRFTGTVLKVNKSNFSSLSKFEKK